MYRSSVGPFERPGGRRSARRAEFRRAAVAQHHAGDVVRLRCVPGEGAHGFHDPIHTLRGIFDWIDGKRLNQPVVPEKRPADVEGFGDAVGEEQQGVARLQLDLLLHVRLVGKTASARSEEHTYELQSLMRTSYAVFCLKKKTNSISH